VAITRIYLMENFMIRMTLAASAACVSLFAALPAMAASDADIAALRAELQGMKQTYESRIADLESKLATMEKSKQVTTAATPVSPMPMAAVDNPRRSVYNNSFNPSIGVILNGRYSTFSEGDSDMAGFAVGEEGERGKEGLALDESELNFSANVDDKFYGSLTASLVREEGEDKVELEEAYVQTLPGAGLPTGLGVKAGRALWTLGYLNEHHTHTDDFADRPLPYRAFLNNAYNDDGMEVTYVLPTALYSEIGGGVFAGEDYPFGDASGDDVGAWSAFARVGGDIGDNQTWRVGGYVLSGDTIGRTTNEDAVAFTGDARIYAADMRYTWAPTGNPSNQELTLQGEYFWRDEDGAYEDTDAATGLVAFDDHASGWYAQGVYKFLPQWRVGYRYSKLYAADTPIGLLGSALDSGGHNPDAHALMVDWTNSEFSRIRLQYNHEELANALEDDQFLVQYIMSIGAHGAHAY
jgi:hypothetical protein